MHRRHSRRVAIVGVANAEEMPIGQLEAGDGVETERLPALRPARGAEAVDLEAAQQFVSFAARAVAVGFDVAHAAVVVEADDAPLLDGATEVSMNRVPPSAWHAPGPRPRISSSPLP